jgi:hypothetical protein
MMKIPAIAQLYNINLRIKFRTEWYIYSEFTARKKHVVQLLYLNTLLDKRHK